MNKPALSWLPYLKEGVPAQCKTPAETAAFELKTAGLAHVEIVVLPEKKDEYCIENKNDHTVITGGECGVLYGAYQLIASTYLKKEIPSTPQKPMYCLRMINCWDNADGTIERGYSGRSLWFEANQFDYDPVRIRQLGRMLASVGLNVLCINNVNVHEPAQELIGRWLPQLAEFAAILRPFGVKLMVSLDYSQPMRDGIPTADPLDERVQQWWKDRAKMIWDTIPDFAGFLVKADSEGRPGPFTYGRSHAEGANMLARAVKPYGGQLIWRCFVYNCQQDWRDHVMDRPKAAYDTYMPLDGQFDENVILQIKNGPYDFQIREPVSPLLLGLKNTNTALEVQLAQEYTGHQIDIYAMPPMWKEVFADLPKEKIMAIAAVSNLGRDENYYGHPFAALNMYAFGRLAWDPDQFAEEMISDWCRLTYTLPDDQEQTLENLLLHSRKIYDLYAGNLGLEWMITPGLHYGPNPAGYEFQAWGTYHRANYEAVGIDRTINGTGYTRQYKNGLCDFYENRDTCPDELLLFFHRVKYTDLMRDGRTLIQRLYDDHFAGYEAVQEMAEELKTLELPSPDREVAQSRMQKQLFNAREWCDITNTFFYRYCGIPDTYGRIIYE